MTNTNNTLDREAWLTEASHLIYDDIIAPFAPRPIDRPFRVSVGFPAGSRGGKTIASCWASAASADGTNEIFVTPALDNSRDILAAVVHELIHYSDDCISGHRGHFARVARAVGLDGKLTATYPNDALAAQLDSYIALLGEIPHAALDAGKSGKGKQTTRMIKVECDACDFVFRATRKNIELMPDNACCPACAIGSLNAAQ